MGGDRTYVKNLLCVGGAKNEVFLRAISIAMAVRVQDQVKKFESLLDSVHK